MSSNLTQFEILKKQRARKRIRKNILFIFLLFVFLFSAYFCYRNDYYSGFVNNINNIGKMFKWGSGYPINLNAASIKGKDKMGKDFLILDEDIIYIFNRFGYKMLYKKHGLNDPREVVNKNKAVIFEHLGKSFKVYSKTEKLFETNLENIIYDISLSNDGKIAIIQGSNRYVSDLEILDNNYQPIFKWSSANKYILAATFDKYGKNFVVTTLDIDGADYVSTLDFFDINQDKKIATIELRDDIIISSKYKYNNIYVIGEKNAYIINGKGEIKKTYSYQGRVLKIYTDEFLKNTVLVFNNYDRSTDNDIIILDDKLNENGHCKIDGNIKDITENDKKFYVLTDGNIKIFDLTPKLINSYDLDGVVTDIIAVGNKVYQFSASKLDILK